MSRTRNWVIGLAASGAAAIFALQNLSVPQEQKLLQPSPTFSKEISTPSPEACAYVWAYHDALELTDALDSALKKIFPEVRAHAEFYGEDCIFTDGHSTFLPRETDFYIFLPVQNLAEEQILAECIMQSLQLISEFPQDEIQGGLGTVEFWFEQNGSHPLQVRIPLQEYLTGLENRNGLDLLHAHVVTP